MVRTTRRFAAWLAFAGVVFSALLPLVSQARPAADRVPLLICGPGGLQTIDVEGGAPVSKPSHGGNEHCGLCLGAVAPIVIDAVAVPDLVAATHFRLSLPREARPHRWQAVSLPPSHAPPAAPAA